METVVGEFEEQAAQNFLLGFALRLAENCRAQPLANIWIPPRRFNPLFTKTVHPPWHASNFTDTPGASLTESLREILNTRGWLSRDADDANPI
ncbi:MAG TPA: hypothetical protein VLM90_04930, partial [Candidatus Deferrimicrobium sp.]|nr:hypothetical protein [Candidatus Deferrimicrobium sp.]